MNTLKITNQNKVDTFLNDLQSNTTIKEVANYFNKDIKEVCKAVEKYIVILYNRNGAIKQIKIDFLETQSSIKIKQNKTFTNEN